MKIVVCLIKIFMVANFLRIKAVNEWDCTEEAGYNLHHADDCSCCTWQFVGLFHLLYSFQPWYPEVSSYGEDWHGLAIAIHDINNNYFLSCRFRGEQSSSLTASLVLDCSFCAWYKANMSNPLLLPMVSNSCHPLVLHQLMDHNLINIIILMTTDKSFSHLVIRTIDF